MRYIEEIQLSNIRCFTASPAVLRDLNVFVGTNNAGKSALINALRRLPSVNRLRHPPRAPAGGAAVTGPDTFLTLEPADRRDGEDDSSLRLALGPYLTSRVKRAAATLRADLAKHGIPLPSVPLLVELDELAEQPVITIEATFRGSHRNPVFRRRHGDGMMNSLSPQAAEPLLQGIEELPVVVIPERRQPSRELSFAQPAQEGLRENIYTADSLQHHLLSWHFEDPTKLQAFKSLAEQVLDAPIRVEFRPSRQQVFLALRHDAPRALENLGSGITSVLVFATALAAHDRGLLLFEEPELHLHPGLQRRLMKLLWERSQNGPWQTLITTHSNHVMDFEVKEGTTTFLIHRGIDDRSTVLPVVQEAGDKSRLRATLEALGVRPSSLCVANRIVWVEGPSDALYLEFFLDQWIRRNYSPREPGPRRHLDYDFAFFGGSLLAHTQLSESDTPDNDALVTLLNIHAGSCVFMDSDRSSDDQVSLGKPYSQRLIDATHQDARLAARIWVSAGREIENYLRDEVLRWSVGENVSIDRLSPAERKFLQFEGQQLKLGGKPRCALKDRTKTDFAEKVIEYMRTDENVDWLDCLDLAQVIERMVAFLVGLHDDGGRILEDAKLQTR